MPQRSQRSQRKKRNLDRINRMDRIIYMLIADSTILGTDIERRKDDNKQSEDHLCSFVRLVKKKRR